MADRRHRDPNRKQSARTAAGKTDPALRTLKQFVVEEIELTDTAPPRAAPPVKKPARFIPAVRMLVAVAGLLSIPLLAALATRSAWPVDETYWLGLTWEMWARGNVLVASLNGVTVASAPLFLWSVHLGWLLFGTVEWWARLVPALYFFASLLLAARLARLLWPGQAAVARYTPLVLLGSFYFLWSATFLTPDLLTLFTTLLAVHALLWMWRTRDLRVWLLLGLAFGLGLLAAGSLIFIYVLPIALLAPLWTRGTPVMRWSYWYADIAKAVLLGLVVFAAWAVPAGLKSGFTAVTPLLLDPFSLHVREQFPADAPWWWLLALLPLAAFPWSLWPLPWLRLWDIRRQPIGNGLAFCMLWATITTGLLLLAPVRQPQLLLPVLPAFFLVGAWLLLDENHAQHDHSRLASTMIFPLLLLGGALAILPGLPRVAALPEFLWQLSPFVGVGIIGVGVAIGWLPIPAIETRIANVAATVAVLTAFVLLATGVQFNSHYDGSGAARVIDSAQRQGQSVAHVGPYAGQFHFAGRLQQPLAVVAADQADAWLAAHPDGLLVTYSQSWQPRVSPGITPFYEQAYGPAHVRLWRAPPAPPPVP